MNSAAISISHFRFPFLPRSLPRRPLSRSRPPATAPCRGSNPAASTSAPTPAGRRWPTPPRPPLPDRRRPHRPAHPPPTWSSPSPNRTAADHLSVRLGDTLRPNIAWTYPTPFADSRKITGLIACYDDRARPAPRIPRTTAAGAGRGPQDHHRRPPRPRSTTR
ncbi:DUF427 domain-containing protein [Kitasatospora cineracea]|uniref:DUF427 domain-containing protein n=1 Tax=Kitasatospora cineracea TaxID=88074 RepID=UPI003814B67D